MEEVAGGGAEGEDDDVDEATLHDDVDDEAFDGEEGEEDGVWRGLEKVGEDVVSRDGGDHVDFGDGGDFVQV